MAVVTAAFGASLVTLRPQACGNSPTCPPGKAPSEPWVPPSKPPSRCAECERAAAGWMVPSEHVLLHREVRDYFDTADVIERLPAPQPPWPSAASAANAAAPKPHKARLAKGGGVHSKVVGRGRPI